MLHLDVMTVTGKTLGENLEDLKKNGYYDRCDEHLRKTGLKRTDIIRNFDEPIGKNGAIAVLKGNLAPQGSVVKHSACLLYTSVFRWNAILEITTATWTPLPTALSYPKMAVPGPK